MKSFEILRYIKKWKYLIIAICILGVVLVYNYALSKQSYTAQTVLRYSNAEASDGKTPSGEDIDVTEIYSSKVITGVLEDLSLNSGADSIRSKCTVQPIISEDEEARKTAILKEGEEYVYNPTDYLITFNVGSEYNKEYAANVLDSILKNYFINYGDKYINQTVLPNNASNVQDGQYDYIESAEILDTSATDIYNYLYDKKFHYPSFRSATTGYSFTDLYNMYKEELNYRIPELYSKILNQKISKDQDVLIKDYKNRISQFAIDLANEQEKVEPLYALISQYSSKSKEGIQYHYGKGSNNDNTNDYILKDVFDENGKKINTETTYDALINQYVKLEVGREYTRIDMEHKQNLLDTFTAATPTTNTEDAIDEIDEDMSVIVSELDQNYSIVESTVNEFNQYLGASNITTLTSINVTEKVNVKMYLMLAIILFLICGCLGAIFLGRMQDFVEYLLYTDKKTKLPNRAKCDMMINVFEEKPLPDNFTFVLIRLDVLKSVNSHVGRTAGDTLLGEFGEILRETAKDYGFVGYNGSDQFMCMFEECSYKKAEMFVSTLISYVELYNSQNPKQDIAFSYAIEETKDKQIFDARGLISASFKDINSNNVKNSSSYGVENADKNENSNSQKSSSKPTDKKDDGGDNDDGGGSGGGNSRPKPKKPNGGVPSNNTELQNQVIEQNNYRGNSNSMQKENVPQSSLPINGSELVDMLTKAVMMNLNNNSETMNTNNAPIQKEEIESPKVHYEPVEWHSSNNIVKGAEYRPVVKKVIEETPQPQNQNVTQEKPVQAEASIDDNSWAEEKIVEDVNITVIDKNPSVGENTNDINGSVNNPYAPKPRVKKSYRTREIENSKISYDSYAPKLKKKR